MPRLLQEILGKSDRNIIIRMDRHETKPDPQMYQHLIDCIEFDEWLKCYALPGINTSNTILSTSKHLYDAAIENTELLDPSNKLAQLRSPEIDTGLKTSTKKKMQLLEWFPWLPHCL